TDGFFSDLFYRLEGDASGTAWNAMEISTNDDVPQRFYDGTATGTPGDHILVGSRVDGAEAQVLMARIDGSGVQWMKQYDLGSAETQFEEATDAVTLSNGEFACIMTARETASTTAAFVMRFNGNGDPIWTTKLTDAGGLFAGAVTELADGSLLVAASSGFAPRLMKLTSGGVLSSSTGCATCFGGIGSFTRTGNGGLVGTNGGMVFEITEDGQACDFTAITTVVSAPFTPTVSNIAASATPTTLTAGDVPMLDRTPANALSDGCVLSSVHELEAGKVLQPYPVPSAGLVRLKDVRPGERFVLRAMDGRAVMQGSYYDGVDLGALPSGVFMLELIASGSRARLVRE
ncbi:MAG: hypothetical protein KDB95_11195, partial [Flavobacteriales bacterium]|nr:hypothetical protein [Flavobacteriales bacterium]